MLMISCVRHILLKLQINKNKTNVFLNSASGIELHRYNIIIRR